MSLKKIVIPIIFLLLTVGCSSPVKKYNIVTTDDWINHVSAAANIEEIDKGLTSMTPNQIIHIGEELSKMVFHLNVNDPQAKAKCRALIYILILPTSHQAVYNKRHSGFSFSELEYNRLQKVFDNSPRELSMMILGSDEVNEIFGEWEDWMDTL